MRVRRIHVLVVFLALAACLIPFRTKVRSAAVSAIQVLKGKKSVAERVTEFGDAVHKRVAARFKEVGVAYPPKRINLVGLKREQVLEVWVSGGSGQCEYLTTYPILGASGTLGPKLVEGDGQVPEGVYKIDSLNPNSLYHLALRVDYPNRFDRAKGALDGRAALGSDIMIHGKSASIGCLAMGDQAAEDLFVMAAESGIENITVILSPVDFRIRSLPATMPKVPPWTEELYADIRCELMKLTRQPDGAANRSQPSRSETNRTSSAAGSRR
ncbi:MAG TPA: hypothetical protein P5186_15795 [Candidatus Paceibacterota bacterium]|nr:hypothetical protein [Candidatus Paceibacterota bacterium]